MADFDPTQAFTEEELERAVALARSDAGNVNATGNTVTSHGTSETGNDQDENLLLLIHAANPASIKAMHALRQKLDKQPRDESLNHHRQFVKNRPTESIASALQIDIPSSPSTSGTEQCNAISSPEVLYDGAEIRISFKTRPFRPAAGWTIGRGRSKLPFHDVDILLPGTGPHNVRGVHAHVVLNETGALGLRAASKGVSINGQPLEQLRTFYLLISFTNYVDIGDLKFIFQYAPHHDRQKHEAAKATYMQFLYQSFGTPHPLASATPTPADFTRTIGQGDQKWLIHGIQGLGNIGSTGARNIIEAATHVNSGCAVALKEIPRLKKADETSVMLEVQLLRQVKRALHVENSPANKYVVLFHSVIYDSNSEEWNGLPDRAYILTTPLAYTDCNALLSVVDSNDVLAKAVAAVDRVRLFADMLKGLSFCHERGVIHRDIKPGNLAIDMSTNPPHAVIIDFGSAFVDTGDEGRRFAECHPRPVHCGTVGYLAPELECADYNFNSEVYTAKVDVFSLGVVATQILPTSVIPKRLSWRPDPNPFKHPICPAQVAKMEQYVMLCKNQAKDSLANLIGQMLQVDHRKRISSAQALQHSILQGFI